MKFRGRPDTDTPLKNGKKSERNVTLSQGVMEVIVDYIEARRKDTTDEYGREPLFTTSEKRLWRQNAYKNIVAWSRPCVFSNECPHNREIAECDAAQRKSDAFSCPSSVSLHPIRRGSITYHLNQGWDKEQVSQRCDVSVKVLEKHYDARTEEEKRQKRQDHVDKL